MFTQVYEKMWLRRRFCKRVLFISFAFIISFYTFVLFFGNFWGPRIMNLTDLNRCPACYGVSVCAELYSNQVILENYSWTFAFNAKNIFHGHTKLNRRVVLKKLAHNWELKDFDTKMCKAFNLKRNCKPIDLFNVTTIDNDIIKTVQYNLSWPDSEPRKGLVFCPYANNIHHLIQPAIGKGKMHDKINVWTMLNINPEPIILQVLQKSAGWPVPAYAGVCGRLEVVAYEGQPLTNLLNTSWYRKLKHTLQILKAALDFTFKHDRFRFYLMDWSLDNIVVNDFDLITFIDLEDIIVLDKHITPTKKKLPNWYERYGREIAGSGFTFSIDNICKHHLSDHNIWAACYILAGDEPYLYPIPKEILTKWPQFEELLKECLNGSDRFKVITKLQYVVNKILQDEEEHQYIKSPPVR